VDNVDSGETDDTSIHVDVPDCATIEVFGSFLGIYCYINGELADSWEKTYAHDINLSGPSGSGSYIVQARLVGERIELSFTPDI
jgi:hypothetical protein